MIAGRTVLISGASRGLGAEIAARLAPGNRVVSLSRSAPADGIEHCACDLGDAAKLGHAIDDLLQRVPDIDVLINNAAVLTSKPVAMMSDTDIGAQVQVNLLAPMLITKRVLKRMMSRRRGRIVNVISMSHRLNKPGDSVYAATKAGLETFGKIVNAEAHPFGITANSLAISAIETGMLEQIAKETPEKIRALIPHGNFADIDGIMAVIDFFCGENSGDIGGQTVHLGGV